MPTIDISIEDFSKLIESDHLLTVNELDNLISFAIAEVDSEPDGPDENGHTKISIDIKTSNRPDLWSAEGLARLVKGNNGTLGLPDLSSSPSDYKIIVDPETEKIRPYIAAAIVRGLKFDDFLIKQMIQIQDKLDYSYGRKRKRSSIGIYNINMISSPIHYKMVDRDFEFTPLNFENNMSIEDIFSNHPKGIEFGHILSKSKKVPILVDSEERVLSLPPIINSHDVGRVTTESKDVLIETTGTDKETVLIALDCVTQALRDRGGAIESVEIIYKSNIEITPQNTPKEIKINPKIINSYLGTTFTNDQIITFLERRRHNVVKIEDELLIKYAPWRKDIHHWVDISEDIAMASDYNTLIPTIPKVVTSGKISPSSEDENMLREIFIGMQLIEVMNYILTDPIILSDKINKPINNSTKDIVEIKNPITSTFSVIRSQLLPILLSFESKNTHIEYPHKIFEIGEVVKNIQKNLLTKTHAAVLLTGSNETFETILSVLDGFMRLQNLDYLLEDTDDKMFISGRRALIKINDIPIGKIGEINPSILNNFGIEVPSAGLEIDLTKIPNLRINEYDTNKL